MRIFLDADVLLAFFHRDEGSAEYIGKLQVMQMLGDAELWVSAKSLADAHDLLERQYPEQSIASCLKECLGFLGVCSIDGDDVEKALDLQWAIFECCLAEVAARKVKAEFILTGNPRGFFQSKAEVMSLSDFFEWLEKEKGLHYEEISWG